MSNEERNEYMRNVRWTTFGYFAFAVASLLVGGAFGVAEIKGDIKDTKIEGKEHYIAINHKLDSIQHDNSIEFKDIWKAIKGIDTSKNTKTIIKYLPAKKSKGEFFTERWINGKLYLLKVE